MKKSKYIFLVFLMAFSFYLTDKVMIYMENKNPLMQEIKAKASFYEISSVNAEVKDNTIIPGINGKEINKRKTYHLMGEFGSFNETFIIYNEIKPEISLQDNLGKIIVRGNRAKRQISLVLEPNAKVENYLNEQTIKYTLITKLDADITPDREYLNGESTREKMSDLNAILNQKKINPKLCLVNYSFLDYCKEKKYYLIVPTLDTLTNITKVLSEIKSGDIILVRAKTGLDNLILILNEIKRQDLEIVYLSTLISESN